MTSQEYLEKKLHTCAHYQLTDDDRQRIETKGLRSFLFEQITRKKFRRWKLPEVARGYIDRALDYCLPKKLPLLVRLRFGGYKLWRLASSPEVDWAEFFALAHYAAYLAPIVAAYEPGVKLLFMSDDVFVEPMDNVPKSQTESYYKSFVKLIEQFKKFFPQNFNVEIIRHSSLYPSEDAWRKEFEAKIHEIEPTWKEQLTPEKIKTYIATSTLNIKWDGVQDLTGLSQEEKEKFIERGALLHEALVKVPTIRAFSDKNSSMFSISCGSLPSVVSIGTTKSSITKFWVGTGVLEEREGMFYDRVLSPSQIERMRHTPKIEVPIDFIPLKNFSHIDAYKEGFDFFSN
ncbi:MAG: hypothetical protein WC495_05970 [Patescibacteria group bacterium]|jgi:hypothetical protein